MRAIAKVYSHADGAVGGIRAAQPFYGVQFCPHPPETETKVWQKSRQFVNRSFPSSPPQPEWFRLWRSGRPRSGIFCPERGPLCKFPESLGRIPDHRILQRFRRAAYPAYGRDYAASCDSF